MILNLVIDIFVFLFGLCIGSFLNCLIYRLEQEKSLAGRSFCPHCKHTLNWTDLFPVFSYLFLGGKCRYCKQKISWQYPVVEIFTGIIFLLIFALTSAGNFAFLNFINLGFLFYISCVLIVIFVYDLKHYLIPDKVLLPAIVVGLVFRVLEFGGFDSFVKYFWAIVVGAGFFLLLFLVSKGRWMGFGDVKLAVLMGLVLGFSNTLVALFLAFLIGSVVSVVLIFIHKKGFKSEIPFAPFLILGTFLAIFYGTQIATWYLNFLKI